MTATQPGAALRRWAGPALLVLGLSLTTAVSSDATTTADSAATRASAPAATAAPAVRAARPAVLSKRVIGRSVKNRPIRAWELGERDAAKTAVIVGRQHGNEAAGEIILESLRDGNPIEGVHLWVVPVANPDGAKRNDRQNAHGVDLNRNWPYKWKALTGNYYSGPRPRSEPETRVLQRFLNKVKPDYLVSIHTPLYGLDVKRAKDKRFARALSEELNLPDRQLNCSGKCHGTLSQWFNHRHKGACVTVEFGANASWKRLTVSAPKGFLRALDARRPPR